MYGQPRINDIVPYVDVNIRSYRDVHIIMRYFDRFVYTDPMIDSAFPASASLVVLAWARLTMSGDWAIMSSLTVRFHANA